MNIFFYSKKSITRYAQQNVFSLTLSITEYVESQEFFPFDMMNIIKCIAFSIWHCYLAYQIYLFDIGFVI